MAIQIPVVKLVEFILPEGVDLSSVKSDKVVTVVDNNGGCIEASLNLISSLGLVPIGVVVSEGYDPETLAIELSKMCSMSFGDAVEYAHGDCPKCFSADTRDAKLKQLGVKSYLTPMRSQDQEHLCSTALKNLVNSVLAS